MILSEAKDPYERDANGSSIVILSAAKDPDGQHAKAPAEHAVEDVIPSERDSRAPSSARD